MADDVARSREHLRLGTASLLTVAAGLVGSGLNYGFHIVLGRLLSPSDYGRMQALLAAYMIVTVTISPLMLILSRSVARFHLAGEHGMVIQTTWRALRITALALAAAAVALAPAARVLLRAFELQRSLTLVWFFLSVGFSLFHVIATSVLLGQLRYGWYNGVVVATTALKLVACATFAKLGWGVEGVFIGLTCTVVLAGSVALWLALRDLPASTSDVPPPIRLADASGAVLLNLTFSVLSQIDVIYVNWALPLDGARGYAAASMLAKFLIYVPTAIATTLLPMVSGDEQAATNAPRLLRKAIGLTAAVIVSGVTGAWLAPSFALRITFGHSYLGAAPMLGPIATALAPYGLLIVLVYYAIARSDYRLTPWLAGICFATLVALGVSTPSLTTMLTAIGTGGAAALACGVAFVAIYSTRR